VSKTLELIKKITKQG